MIQILKPDKEALLWHISQCRGDVLMVLRGGTTCNLKTDSLAIELLRTLEVPEGGIFLSLSDDRDLPRMIRYLLEEAG